MDNYFKRNNASYDINYLKAEDLTAKPSVDGLTTKVPQLQKDAALMTSLYALDPDMTPEVAEYFKKKATKMREKENAKYAEVFAKMTDAHVLHEFNTQAEHKVIIHADDDEDAVPPPPKLVRDLRFPYDF